MHRIEAWKINAINGSGSIGLASEPLATRSVSGDAHYQWLATISNITSGY